MKYLLFIANELADDTNRADVSYRKIKEFFVSRSTSEIDLALKILVARGILKTGTDKKRYGFTTMFYFDFFRSQVSEAKIQALYIWIIKSINDIHHISSSYFWLIP